MGGGGAEGGYLEKRDSGGFWKTLISKPTHEI